jgi:hypothetical protein
MGGKSVSVSKNKGGSTLFSWPVSSYLLARLIEPFGEDAVLPDLLLELAACQRRQDFSRSCSARFTDLAGRR